MYKLCTCTCTQNDRWKGGGGGAAEICTMLWQKSWQRTQRMLSVHFDYAGFINKQGNRKANYILRSHTIYHIGNNYITHT